MGLYQLGSNVLFLVVKHALPSRGSKADPCGTGSSCWPFSQHPLRADVIAEVYHLAHPAHPACMQVYLCK